MKAPQQSFLAACAIAALAACSCSNRARPAPSSDGAADGTGGVGSSTITYWLAPNGSEVVLQLVTTKPTVPF